MIRGHRKELLFVLSVERCSLFLIGFFILEMELPMLFVSPAIRVFVLLIISVGLALRSFDPFEDDPSFSEYLPNCTTPALLFSKRLLLHQHYSQRGYPFSPERGTPEYIRPDPVRTGKQKGWFLHASMPSNDMVDRSEKLSFVHGPRSGTIDSFLGRIDE